jgi:hypothetical protein
MIIPLSENKLEGIARAFCFFEGINPDDLVYVSSDRAMGSNSTGVVCCDLVYTLPNQTPMWRTLIPEIQRTYSMLKAFEASDVQI